MLKEGKILQDRYRIEKQIGQGGMGSVYLATDERFNSTVAIKETLFTDDNYRKAFSREARLLNSLKHTALPKVSDHFIDGNGQYIVMEYIAGDDLFEMLEKSGEAFPLSDVLIWAEQLLDALEYLHGQEVPIIHRDIKPQNLKLTPQGQVILLDFGLAKGNPTDANHKTAANSIFGYSRNYASLEQIQGTGTDPRSDIYSLAATLYHLLTGKPPADALTRVMMVLNEEKDPLQKASLIHEQVPDDIASYLEEAMSLNANLRPQSAVEMRELLSGKSKTNVTTKPNTSPNKAAGTNIYSQNTKVFTEDHKSQENSQQSDIRTEVLHVGGYAGDSVKTKIAKPQTLTNKKVNTQNPLREERNSFATNKMMLASIAGILLLVGSVASMVYFLDSNPKPKIEPEQTTAQSSLANGTYTNSNSNTNLDNANLLTESNANNSLNDNLSDPQIIAEKDSADRLQDKSSENKNEGLKAIKDKQKTANVIGKSKDQVLVSDGKIKTDEVTISNDTIETKDIIIQGDKFKVKVPTKGTKYPPNAPISREEYESLTPAQQKRVREAMELKKRMDDKRRRDDRNRRLRDVRRRNTSPPPPPPPPPPS